MGQGPDPDILSAKEAAVGVIFPDQHQRFRFRDSNIPTDFAVSQLDKIERFDLDPDEATDLRRLEKSVLTPNFRDFQVTLGGLFDNSRLTQSLVQSFNQDFNRFGVSMDYRTNSVRLQLDYDQVLPDLEHGHLAHEFNNDYLGVDVGLGHTTKVSAFDDSGQDDLSPGQVFRVISYVSANQASRQLSHSSSFDDYSKKMREQELQEMRKLFSGRESVAAPRASATSTIRTGNLNAPTQSSNYRDNVASQLFGNVELIDPSMSPQHHDSIPEHKIFSRQSAKPSIQFGDNNQITQTTDAKGSIRLFEHNVAGELVLVKMENDETWRRTRKEGNVWIWQSDKASPDRHLLNQKVLNDGTLFIETSGHNKIYYLPEGTMEVVKYNKMAR